MSQNYEKLLLDRVEKDLCLHIVFQERYTPLLLLVGDVGHIESITHTADL
jgi:hypothetical protein